MTRRYKKPPLSEALAEFRFVGSQPWDWTIPGLLYDKIRENYPEKAQENFLQVGVQPQAETVSSQLKSGVSKMQFFRKDRTRVVQVGPDLLTINQLSPYPGWTSFRPELVSVLDEYRRIASPEKLLRVSLRYINRFDLGTEPIDLGDYFLSLPKIADPVPQSFDQLLMSVDIRPEQDVDSPVLRFTFGSDPGRSAGRIQFIMDLEYSVRDHGVPNFNDVPRWLDGAHDRIEQVFDVSCTEKTHAEVFQEIRE